MRQEVESSARGAWSVVGGVGLGRFLSERPERVVLYGAGSEPWRNALGPGSDVWNGVAGVNEVVLAEGLPDLLRAGWAGGRQSIVIPLRRPAMQAMPPFYWSLAPTRRAHDTCDDKRRFARFMAAAGLADLMPRSWEDKGDCRFPCLVKRNNRSGSDGVAIVNSPAELEAVMAVPPFRRRPVMFQELVDGLVDHATHTVAVAGRIVWHTSYAYDIDPATRLQTSAVHATRRRIGTPPAVLAQFERVLAALRYDGPASFDWRPRGSGFVLFEVNPRFGGSMMLPINRDDLRAGVSAVLAHARPPGWLGRRS